jgi:hypothetical protein
MIIYGDVSDEDVFQWWRASEAPDVHRSIASGSVGNVFLFGYEADNDPGSIDGTAKLSLSSRVIFPLICSKSNTKDTAAHDIDDKGSGVPPDKYARINGSDVPSNNIHRVRANNNAGYYDGYWVCITSGLSDGDKISFGGDGPEGFKTEADWVVHRD